MCNSWQTASQIRNDWIETIKWMNWIVIDSIISYWLEQAFKEWNKMWMEFVVWIRFVCTEWDNTNVNGNECVNNWTLGFGVQNDYVNTSHKDITILIDRIICERLNWVLQSKLSLFWVLWDWFNWNRVEFDCLAQFCFQIHAFIHTFCMYIIVLKVLISDVSCFISNHSWYHIDISICVKIDCSYYVRSLPSIHSSIHNFNLST